ncbi:hypothetical protein SCHIN_v1c01980 [Spiroplasma chinense]|uniref:PvuRts1 I-like SET and RING associated domain-containing protein n=1 Tax=Spiroplasma chinense TaxID=216932 RepID=A0A5B9Y401_9MOLU|nr:hypothetical protein [Spiroplasma chinense]QEH61396.1 hypothetical protein SCHIN_v1c01980 [Spiroplasma chinense]
MSKTLGEVIEKQLLSSNDEICFPKIADIISQLFTDKNGISMMKVGYRINEDYQILCLNLEKNMDIEIWKESGYYNWVSNDGKTIHRYNALVKEKKRKKDVLKLIEKPQKFLVFAQYIEKSKKSQYKFIGVYEYSHSEDIKHHNMIFMKTSDEFQFNFKNAN